MAAYESQLMRRLLELSDLLRAEGTALERSTLSALVTYDVHAHDVVVKMKDQQVASLTDFVWISQLRHYWRHDDAFVDMVQASIHYG